MTTSLFDTPPDDGQADILLMTFPDGSEEVLVVRDATRHHVHVEGVRHDVLDRNVSNHTTWRFVGVALDKPIETARKIGALGRDRRRRIFVDHTEALPEALSSCVRLV